jgi:hypothetical protein
MTAIPPHADSVLAIAREAKRSVPVAWDYAHDLISRYGWAWAVQDDNDNRDHIVLTPAAAALLRLNLGTAAVPATPRFMAYAHQGLGRVFLMVVDTTAKGDDWCKLAFELEHVPSLVDFPVASAGHRLIERGWMPYSALMADPETSRGGWATDVPDTILSRPVHPLGPDTPEPTA